MQMPQQSQDSAYGSEGRIKRRIIGFLMFPLSLFPLLALISYDWHRVSALCIPPATPGTNMIGVVGDNFAYIGYSLVGFSLWIVPFLCVIIGILLVAGCRIHPGRRIIGLALFTVSLTCLVQLTGTIPFVRALMHDLNIEPNAGGAVGYLIMTRGLAPLLSPFGSGVLMAVAFTLSILLLIGLQEIIGALARLTAWAADRDAERQKREEENQRENAIAAALAASDEKKARELAEKQRIAEERAAEKAAREREREERRAQREAERQAKLEAKEAERRAREEKLAEEERERERLRQIQQSEIDAMRAEQSQKETPKSGFDDPFPAREKPTMRPMRTVAAPAPVPRSAPPPPPAAAASAGGDSETIAEPVADKGPYILPPVSLLNKVPQITGGNDDPSAMADRLIDTLKVFDVNAQLAYYVAGPVVTQYALALDLGTRVEKVAGLQRNIQMALQATSLRIEAPIPGKNAVGIEVPNAKPASIFFRQIIDGKLWQENSEGKFQLPLLLGKDAAGNDLVADLAKLPHLLVAGATGQGKSVCLNSIINGLLMCRTPEQLKFIMVDPKRVEFTSYRNLPHLLVPIINDTKKVVFALRAALVEMDRRLKMFAKAGCRNIVDFNNRKTVIQPDMFDGSEEVVGGNADIPRTVPYIVIVIDEVADIMQAEKKDVEPVIARLTALARATGIHLILATQRPSADIITGVIKGNIPGRIAFKTSSSIDSRTILDATGSELLIGKGDMLFKMSDGRLLRAQGSWITDEEIARIIEFIEQHSNVQFDEKLTRRMERIKEVDPADSLEESEEAGEEEHVELEPLARPTAGGIPPPPGMTQSKEDAIYRRALEVLRDTKRASISHFQRRMGIGYNHAARIVDLLEERGVISTAKGAGPREILIDPETLLAEGAPQPEGQPAAEPGEQPADLDPLGATL